MSRSQYLCAVFLVFAEVIGAHRFGYSEPNQRRWARHHGHCAGKTQSPIAVHSSKAIPLHMPAIDMVGYHNLLPFPLNLTNNGHTVSITIPKLSVESIESGDFMPYVRGGKLPGEFEVESVHFHWGDKNNRGSEHVVNDIRYAMEMHIVHRNKKYATLVDALDNADGAAVLGFFFSLDEEEGPGLAAVTRHLHLIPDADDATSLNVTFSLSSLISNVDVDKFYTYKGSLTTPPCSEAVTWVLYPDPTPISPKQISRFRQLQDTQDGALVDNYRQLQPIGTRRVFMRLSNTRHTHIANLISEVSSLTTPPCSEAVTWVLYPDPTPISPKQISRFRQLQDTQDGALVDNYRQLQPIGTRRVFMRLSNTRHTHIANLISEVSYRKWKWFY